MPSNKTYTRSQVDELMKDMVEIIKTRKSWADRPADFIKEHPWTNKYLSTGFAEANQLLELAKEPAFDIRLVSISETENMWRHDRKMKMKLHFRTTGGTEHDRVFIFYFKEQEEDIYIPLNG
jgi:hypothetical protein